MGPDGATGRFWRAPRPLRCESMSTDQPDCPACAIADPALRELSEIHTSIRFAVAQDEPSDREYSTVATEALRAHDVARVAGDALLPHQARHPALAEIRLVLVAISTLAQASIVNAKVGAAGPEIFGSEAVAMLLKQLEVASSVTHSHGDTGPS